MMEAVETQYPDHEKDLPIEQRQGFIPVSILEALDAFVSHSEEDRSRRRLRLMSDKSATPGDGASSMDTVLDNVRPHTMCLDKSAASASDPATMRQGAIDRCGDLESKEQKRCCLCCLSGTGFKMTGDKMELTDLVI